MRVEERKTTKKKKKENKSERRKRGGGQELLQAALQARVLPEEETGAVLVLRLEMGDGRW